MDDSVFFGHMQTINKYRMRLIELNNLKKLQHNEIMYVNAQTWMRKHRNKILPFNKENNYKIEFLTTEAEMKYSTHKYIKYLFSVGKNMLDTENEIHIILYSEEWQSAYYYFAKQKERGYILETPSRNNDYNVVINILRI